jgi:hypothetical protein
VTNRDAKARGYKLPLMVQIADAYRAEHAEGTLAVEFPELRVGEETSYDKAKDGHVEAAIVPPLMAAPAYAYHTKWRFVAKSAMMRGAKPFDLKVTWPVTYQWSIARGKEFLESSGPAGRDAFEITFKKNGITLADCVSIRLSASDAYGHSPEYELDLCGGLTNAEAADVLAHSKDLAAAIEAKINSMKTKPPPGPPIIGEKVKASDPAWQAARDLQVANDNVRIALAVGNRPFEPSSLRTIAFMAPAVAKLQKLDPGFFSGAAFDKAIYTGTPAQRAALDALKGKVSAAAVAHYVDGFKSLTAIAIHGMYPSAGSIAAKANAISR